MTINLYWLALVTVLTGVLWVPYVLNRIAVRGLADTVGYPADPKPQAAWAVRLKCAHANATENLVVFAVLVLVAHAAGVSSDTSAFACEAYFWARLLHAVAYTLAWPWIRTLAFTAGFASQATLAWLVLG